MGKCLICRDSIEPFMSFGKMPLANGFLTKERFTNEYFFELKVSFCSKCVMLQLAEQPEAQKMFHENYPFLSGTSSRMAVHFKEFAYDVMKNHLRARNPFVMEIGSNDGIMLQHFAAGGIRHLGIEPSASVANIAREKGVQTLCGFFNEEMARNILREHGQTDAFLGANVMCHVSNLNSVISGIKILLKPDGVILFEDPYLGDVIEKISYDQIYDEHAFLFSVSSIQNAFERQGMEVVDVEPQPTHGGSMRYVIAHTGMKTVSRRVTDQLEKEKTIGLQDRWTYERFKTHCERSRDKLRSLLTALKEKGKRVAGYAATSKSTTVLNYAGIRADLIEYISDTTPAKQGKFSPGMHIPVRPYKEFSASYPDYAVLFAWNHMEEIMAKEHKFKEAGGKWIVFVPEVKVLE